MFERRLLKLSQLLGFVGVLVGRAAASNTPTLPQPAWTTFLSRTIPGDESVQNEVTSAAGDTYVFTLPSGTYPFRVLRYDSSGTKVGDFSLADPNSHYFYGFAVDGSGNIYAATTMYTYGHYSNTVFKFNSSGSLLWTNSATAGGNSSVQQRPFALVLDASQNVVVVGQSIDYNSYPYRYTGTLASFSPSGSLLWSRTLNYGGNFSYLYRVTVDASGTLFAGGYTWTTTGYSPTTYPWVTSLDPSQNTLFSVTITAIAGYNPSCLAYSAVDNAAYVAFAHSTRQIFKLDGTTGAVLGSTGFVSTSGSFNQPIALRLDGSGNLAFAFSYYWNADGRYDPTLVRFSPSFAILGGWPQRFLTDFYQSSYYGGFDGSANLTFASSYSASTDGHQVLVAGQLTSIGAQTWETQLDDLAKLGNINTSRITSDAAGRSFDTASNAAPFLAAIAPGGATAWISALSSTVYSGMNPCGVAMSGSAVVRASSAVLPDGYAGVVLQTYDASGALLATTAYDQSSETNVYPGAVAVDGSGNTYVAAYRYDFSVTGQYQPHMVKLDPTGVELWRGVVTTTDSFSARPIAVTVDDAGNSTMIINDQSTSTPWLYSFDASGALRWSVSLLGDQPNVYLSDLKAVSSSVFVVGYESGNINGAGILFALDGGTGLVRWSRTSSADNPTLIGTYYFGLGVDDFGQLRAVGYGYQNAVGWGTLDEGWGTDGSYLFTDFYGSPSTIGYPYAAAGGSAVWAAADYDSTHISVTKLVANPLRASVALSASPVAVHAPLAVVLTVTNTHGVAVNGVTPSIDLNQGGGLLTLVAGPTPAGPLVIAGHATQSFTWTYSVTGAGTLEFTGTAQGTSADDGRAIGMDAAALTLSDYKAHLAVAGASSATTIFVGRIMTVTLTVTNDGDATATALVPSLSVGPGAGLVTPVGAPSPAGVASLATSSSATFTWTFTATADGPVTFAMTVTGNAGIFAAISSSVATSSATLLRRAAFVSAMSAPKVVSVGQPTRITLTVTNTGQVAASGVSATLGFSAGAGTLTLVDGSNGTQSLAGGSATTFVWDFTAAAAGPVSFSQTVTGTDTGVGDDLTFLASSTLLVQTPAHLVGALASAQSAFRVNQADVVVLTVTNTGQAAAVLGTPTGEAGPSAPALVTRLVGPVPAGPVTIPGGAAQSFTWVYQGAGNGSLGFSATVTAQDANSGSGVAISATTPVVSVIGSPRLAVALALEPPTVKAGQTFVARLTVTNVGTASANAVGGALMAADATKAAVTAGPSPAGGGVLAAGASVTFAWQVVGKAPGAVTLTGSATGFDPIDASAVGADGQANETILAAFDKPSVTYPNPVNGDAFSLALQLNGDASSVEVDVYNPAFKRVYQRIWTGVSTADAPLLIDGVLQWAPGMYLVRAKATLVSGVTQTFPTVKVMVKR